MFAALPTCDTPFFETGNNTGQFTFNGSPCNPCDPGQHWSNSVRLCVFDDPINVHPPAEGIPEWVWLAMGAVVLIALMPRSRGGGGGSRRSSSKLLSRTTTRSIFG